jgi:predicted DNA-binding transcriptional regulator AlpA
MTYIEIRDFAKLIGTSTSTARRAAARPDFPRPEPNWSGSRGKLRWRREVVEAWISAQRAAGEGAQK